MTENPDMPTVYWKPSCTFELSEVLFFYNLLIFFCHFVITFWDSRHVQLATYIVFDEKSASEVKQQQILKPGGKIGKTNQKHKSPYIYSMFFTVETYDKKWHCVVRERVSEFLRSLVRYLARFFDQIFDQVCGRGTCNKYSVQFYLADSKEKYKNFWKVRVLISYPKISYRTSPAY